MGELGFKISWFQLFIYFLRKILAPLTFFISCLFTFCQLNVYFFVSWLFTFLSADCLLLSAVCLQFDFSRQNHVFSSVFCQNDVFKLEMSADCLHFQLFVYIFSCLFTFVSCLFTLSADFSYLFTFCQLISAVCLLFVSWNQLFVYFLSADCLQFEFSRQKPCFSMTFLPLQMLQHFNC